MAERGKLRPCCPFLNIDAGEHDDEPVELYGVAHAVSIACGGHAGDERSMERVLRACKAHGTRAGAHPSYDDREGFGRRAMEVDDYELLEGVVRQLRALEAIADDVGVRPTHVKPHGALYHAANGSDLIARVVTLAMRTASPYLRTLIGPPGRRAAARPTPRDRSLRRARGSPIARCAPTGRSCRAESPAQSSRLSTRCARRHARSSRKGSTTRSAFTATRPARS